MEIHTPKIQPDVRGPDGQPGFLLIVPRSEAIDWDVRNEIGSTSRHWMGERQAWWVAAPYRHVAEGIVDRYTGPAAAPAPPFSAPETAPAAEVPLPPAHAALPVRGLRARWWGMEAVLRRWWRGPGEVDSA